MDDPVAACAALLVSCGAPRAGAERAAEALVARYREPGRCYHTVAHVAAVLEHVDELVAAGEPVTDLAAVRLAAWYHDAVVTLSGRGDEERSAVLAGQDLRALGMDPPRVERVARLVRATADHRADDADGRLLVDADLAVLGASPAAYDAYAAAVRGEYVRPGPGGDGQGVDEATFARGRAAVLRALLDRDPLFSTPTLRARAEAQARRNLRRELAALEASGGASGGASPERPAPQTAFAAAVTRIVAATAPGEVVTYGEVAAEAGSPGAARAVGSVLRRSSGLPWWRVVAASGRLVSGKRDEQARRLRAEGVEVVDGRVRPRR